LIISSKEINDFFFGFKFGQATAAGFLTTLKAF